jgi:arabinan endo-1,5-alpha-L-arabinosidase
MAPPRQIPRNTWVRNCKTSLLAIIQFGIHMKQNGAEQDAKISDNPPWQINQFDLDEILSLYRDPLHSPHENFKMFSRPLSYFTIAVSFLLQVDFSSAFADPLECSGTCTNSHDPSIIQRSSDGTYFRFSTGGGLSIHTADSITGSWTYVGVVLESGSSINNAGSDDAWAPDVHLVGDTYYLYYAVSSFGTQESVIGVATSSSMDPGTWTDHGSTGLSSTSGDLYNAIDANLFQASGTNYMTFGSFWGDIFQTTMSSDALTVAGRSPYQIEVNDTGTRPSEGAYIVQHDNYYYLFFSSGICCGYDSSRPSPGEEYKIMVCRSSYISGGYVCSGCIPQELFQR